MKHFRLIFRNLRGAWALILLSVLCALLANSMTIAAPFLIGVAVDDMIGAGAVDFERIFVTLAELAGLYLVGFLFSLLLQILAGRISLTVVSRLRTQVYAKLSHAKLDYIDTHRHGDLIARAVGDIENVYEGVTMAVTNLLSGVIAILGSLVFMLVLNWLIALIVFLMVPLSFLVSRFITRNSAKYFRAQTGHTGELNGHIEEYVSAQKLVKVFGLEEHSQQLFEEKNAELKKSGTLAQFFSALTNPSTRLVNNVIYILLGLVGGLLSLRIGLSIGKISSFLSYSSNFSQPINNITSVTTQLQTAFASLDRIEELLQAEDEDPSGTEHPAEHVGTVDFEKVCFSYTPDRPLIENFSLHAERGQKIAIVGPTGSGKTTLINLLMRFYDVRSGRIALDGTDIAKMPIGEARGCFGMVLQDTWLFAGTIRENILFGKPDATEEEYLAAVRAANLEGLIKKLDKGSDTMLSENDSLSSGQKQLVTIARAMLALPDMLILDEATSNVDTLTEQRITDAFQHMMKGRTSFIIAHRLSTIRNADRILVLNNGNVVEQGTHDELIAGKGLYADLYRSQFEA